MAAKNKKKAKVAGKKAKKPAKKKGPGPAVAKAVGSPPESVKVKQAWMFSRNSQHVYVPETTTWAEFRDGRTSLLRFHAVQLPPPALQLEIEEYAAKLDDWMLRFRYGASENARAEIRSAVATATKPLADLLSVMDENYREEDA